MSEGELDTDKSREVIAHGRWVHQIGGGTLIWVVLAAIAGGMIVVIASFLVVVATRKTYRACKTKLCLANAGNTQEETFHDGETWCATWSRGKEFEDLEEVERVNRTNCSKESNNSSVNIKFLTDI